MKQKGLPTFARHRRKTVGVCVVLAAVLSLYLLSWGRTRVLPFWSARRVLLIQLGPHGTLQLTHLTPHLTGQTQDINVAYGSATALQISHKEDASGAITWILGDEPLTEILPWIDHRVGGPTVGIDQTLLRQNRTVISLPLHLPVAAVSLLAGHYFYRRSKAGKGNSHACPVCHYDLRATPTRCPECGYEPAAPVTRP